MEGFWRYEDEYSKSTSVVYRVERPETNDGFTYAERPVFFRQKAWLPIRLQERDFNRVVGRWKASETGIYYGTGLIPTPNGWVWVNATATFLNPTTVETTIHYQGGITGRSHLAGPNKEFEIRSAAGTPSARVPAEAPALFGGSGFLISNSLVITNAHVVEHASSIRCFVDGWRVEAKILSRDTDNDLALLEINPVAPANIPILKVGKSIEVRQGQTVYALGYPLIEVLGDQLRAHAGIVSSAVGFGGATTQFQVEMALNVGNSGGPLLNDRGAVIGVVSAKLGMGVAIASGTLPEGVAFAVKSELIGLLAAGAGKSKMLQEIEEAGIALPLERIIETVGKGVVRVESDSKVEGGIR